MKNLLAAILTFAALAGVSATIAQPAIGTHPQNLAVTVGQNATFSVTATGAGAVTYQWRRNGFALAGATNASYTVANASRTDADYYDVVVADGSSVSVSQTARLSVAPTSYATLVTPDSAWDLRPEGFLGSGYAVVSLADGRCYLGGAFASANGTRRTSVMRTLADGTLDPTFVPPEIDASVRALAVQPDGRLIIGGDFVRVNGAPRNRLARLNVDGSLDPTFGTSAGASSTVSALAVQTDGRIIVGGFFSSINGVTRNFFARLTADGAIDASFLALGFSSNISAVAVQSDGKILVGGGFTTGYQDLTGIFTARTRLARLNSDGSLDVAFNPNINSNVNAIVAQGDGKLVIGGSFTSVNSTLVGDIARLNADGTLDTAFTAASGTGFNSSVNALALQDDGKILAGGNFTSFAGATTNYFARINASGSRDTGLLTLGFGSPVNAVAVQSSGKIVTGGFYSSYYDASNGYVSRWVFARLNADGTLDSGLNFALLAHGEINTTLTLPGGKLLLTGYFSRMRGAAVPAAVARINADGTLDATFNPGGSGANSNVHAAARQADGKILIGGYFSSYNGTARNGIARLNADGTLDPGHNVSGSGAFGVNTIVPLPGGRAFVGGSFTTVHGVARNRVAMLNADGTLDASFDPGAGASGTVNAAVLQPDGKLIISGFFSTYNGVSIGNLARLNPNGTLDPTFNPGGAGSNATVGAVALQPDGKLVIGGFFNTYNGATRNGVARLNADGTLDPTFAPPSVFSVYGLLVQEDGKVVLRGTFSSVGGGAGTAYLARLNADGSRDASFAGAGFTQTFTMPTGFAMRDNGQLAFGSSYNVGFAATQASSLPSITAQPQNQIAASGGSVTFSVGVTSPLPMSFQWFRDGTAVPGATNISLALTNLQPAQAGSYSLLISSELGSVMSAPALLSGSDTAPVIATQPQSQSVTTGAAVTLNVSATGGAFTYQWRRNGIAIAGATGATLNLGAVTRSFADSYDVVVINGLSVTVSQPAKLTVAPATYPQVLAADPGFNTVFEALGGTAQNFLRLSSGKLMVVGSFTRLGGIPARNIARLNADGTVDATFASLVIDGQVNTVIAQPDGKLVIGGSFNNINGQSRFGLARLNADGTLDTAWAPGQSYQTLNALALQSDGKIVVGGSSTNFSFLARVNADGSRDTSFNPAPNTTVHALAVQSDGKILVGGSFTSIAGGSFNRLARLNTDGTPDTGFSVGTGFNSDVRALRVLGDGRVLAGGLFATYGAATVGPLVRLTAGGAIDPLWAPGTGASGIVFGIDLQGDGKILLGGSFSSYNGLARTNFARLLADGALDTAFAPAGPSSTVNAVSYLNDGTLLIGGFFTSAGGQSAYGIARYAADGSALVAGLVPGMMTVGSVNRVAPLGDGRLMVGGSFTHVNNTPARYLVRLDAGGLLDPTFNSGGAGPGSSVGDLFVQGDGKLVIAGSFLTYNGVSRGRLARLNANGTLDTAFDPGGGPNATPLRIHPLGGGRVLLVGTTGMVTYNGVSRSSLMRVNADGTLDLSFDAGAPDSTIIAALPQLDGRLIVVGSFTTINGVARSRISRLLSNGAVDPTFTTSADNTINAVALQLDGKILIGGSFLVVNGMSRTRVARLHPDGTLDNAWDPGIAPSSTVTIVAPQEDGRIVLGGSFSSINNQPHTGFLARLQSNGALDPSFAAPAFNTGPGGLTVLDSGALLLNGSYLRFGTAQRYGLVRTISDSSGPIILANPGDSTLAAGGTLSLSISTAGGMNVSYQWLKNGVPVAGANGAFLTLGGVQAGDAGSYTVQVNHSGGSFASATAVVTVTASMPVASSTSISGFAGIIAAGTHWPLVAPNLVAGSAPITYQWSRDGVAVSGATGSTFNPLAWQTSDTGSYQVTVSNSLGTLTSSPFTQTVATTPDWQWRFPLPQGNNLLGAAYLGGRFVATGTRGTVLTSTDGLAWTMQRLGASDLITGVAYSGGLYVAIGQYGTVFSSPDAAMWTRRNSGTGGDGRFFSTAPGAVAYGAGRFVVVGSRGLVVTSSDGINWSSVSPITTDFLNNVAFGSGRFVALGAGGRTITSADGLNWSHGPLLPESASYLAYGGGLFAAAAGNYVYTSPDGVAWTRRSIPTTSSVGNLQHTGAGFLAPLSTTIPGKYAASPDGLVWTEKQVGFNLTASMNVLTHGAGRFVMVGNAPETLLTSVDGVAWTRTGPPTFFNFLAAAASNTVAVAVGSVTVGSASAIYSSPDGYVWTARGSGLGNQLNDVTFAAGTFVAVGSGGTILTSPDGAAWTGRTSGTTSQLRGVSYLVDRFYAVGDAGTVLTSSDGMSWTALPTGSSQNLYQSAYGAGTFVIIGPGGATLTSPNGATWTTQTVAGGGGTGNNDILFVNGQFVWVGTTGVIRTSPDGLNWTTRTNPIGFGLTDVAYIAGRYVALVSGNTGYLTSTDGMTWTPAQNGSGNSINDIVQFGGAILGVGNSASILALALPVIATQPATQTATPGASVTFATVASGPGPLAYQWYKNGSAITGATNATFTIGSVTGSDAGSYSVGVTNGAGTAFSNGAALTVLPPAPPSITTQPQSQAVSAGQSFTFSVGVAGTAPFTYQWRKDATAIAGATGASYTVASAQAGDAGSYTVVVTNSVGTATSGAATLSVIATGITATHAVVGAGYTAGAAVTITNTITYAGTATGLGWQVLLPAGWSYASDAGSAGDVKPSSGQTELLEWAWTTIPASPATFTYTLNVPASATGDKQLAALMILRQGGPALQILAKPDPLVVSQVTTHSADTDRNFRLSLLELTRVIELYNTRNGTSRTGCYKVDATGEDGFNPEPTRTGTALVTLTVYHSGDSDRNGKLSLLELTRVIELYNYRSGTTRTGQYRALAGTEDGYAPGP